MKLSGLTTTFFALQLYCTVFACTFVLHKTNTVVQGIPLYISIPDPSKSHCLFLCFTDPSCIAVLYNKEVKNFLISVI
uniref:Secreted protein n=1 Tax=Haemonchus contortus TaxID=6289 RepID=A0A912MP24_HAECO